MLYVLFVAYNIMNTIRLSPQQRFTVCVVLCMLRLELQNIEPVVIVFYTLTIFCCCQTQDGVSPVFAASANGHTEVVDLLVLAGADIHLATTEVHVSTYTVSSSVASFVETSVRLIEFVVCDPHFH